jgi:hypothetical protein
VAGADGGKLVRFYRIVKRRFCIFENDPASGACPDDRPARLNAPLYSAYSRRQRAVSNSYAFIRIFRKSGAASRRGIGRNTMTLFHAHRGEMFGSRGLSRGSRFSVARATRKISAALKAMHCAIVTARLHRLRHELMLHRSARTRVEFDAAKFPQRPMALGDKWDF